MAQIRLARDGPNAGAARERQGRHAVGMQEINDGSGPSFEVAVEGGDERRTLLVGADERIVGERR